MICGGWLCGNVMFTRKCILVKIWETLFEIQNITLYIEYIIYEHICTKYYS